MLTASLAILVQTFSVAAHADLSIEGRSFADIDWEQAPTVVLNLQDNVFNPDELNFERERPYKLVLNNISELVTHDLSDLKFLHAIALNSVTIDGTTINTHHIHQVKLRPNSKASLYFVPVITGEYMIFCSMPGHREDGMEGFITIE